MSPTTALLILRLLDSALLAARAIPEWRSRNRAALSRVRAMIEEGRDPTPAEFAELDAESAALSAELERIINEKSAQ